MEEKRIAVIAVVVKDRENAMHLNLILHDYGNYIISRNGIPYKEINIITVILDAPQDVVSALSGKIGKLQGVEAKTSYLKV